MKRQLAAAFRGLLRVMPRSEALFKLGRMYTNFYSGDDLPDFHSNGESRVVATALPKCRVAFDVGANVGDWTELALALNPNLQVHCFEPSGKTFERIVAKKFGPNVHANQLGLSDAPGEATFHTFGDAATVNSLYSREHTIWKATGTETIKLDTLDAYCARAGVGEIDYLKIDTEGHEFGVLKGGDAMIRGRRVGLIQVEYGGGYIEAGVFFKQVYDRLAGYGYEAYKIRPRGMLHLPQYTEEVETFRLSNWLFIRSGHPLTEALTGRRPAAPAATPGGSSSNATGSAAPAAPTA